MSNIQKEINTPISFNSENNNLISHKWEINNVVVSTKSSFKYIFDTAGLYNITYSGIDTNGVLCTPSTKTIEIIEAQPVQFGFPIEVGILLVGVGALIYFNQDKERT